MRYQPHPSGRPWPSPIVGALFFAGVLLIGWGRIALRGREPAPIHGSHEQAAPTPGYDLKPFADFLAENDGVSQAAPEFQRGVGLGLYSRDPEYDYGGLIREIAGHNAGSILLSIQLYQDRVDSTEIEPAFASSANPEAWSGVLGRAMDQARGAGLEVGVMPIVLLRRGSRNEWRGRIRPADLDMWFESYSKLVIEMARLSAERGAKMFCVGSELSSLESERGRWLDLIARVREVFPGRLTYSANWDHYAKVPFWNRLDAISISGYYELTQSNEPALDELVASWAIHRNRLLAWRRKAGLTAPVWFTELGYPNLDGATTRPWDYTRRAGADPAEQAMGYEAFIRAWNGQPDLGGVWFYQWFGHPTENDKGYSPRGKPAAELIKRWYQQEGKNF